MLEKLAGDMPLGAYIRRKVFDAQRLKRKPARARSRRPVKDEKKLAQVLAMLGQSRISNNLNQLAKMANFGTLPVLPDTEPDIRRACADVALIPRELLRAYRCRTIMTLKGSQRKSVKQLGLHLLKTEETEHVNSRRHVQ